jgi:hypothetical protein
LVFSEINDDRPTSNELDKLKKYLIANARGFIEFNN